MASFNKVILLGNLTRDPQVKYTAGGTAVTEIGLAVNHQWFDKQSNSKREEVTFVDVTLWGRTAEIAGEYLAKGRPVLIEGRLKTDSWDDKETGKKRSRLTVVGENMTMLGSRGDGPSGGGGGGYSGGQQRSGGGGRPQQAMSAPQDQGDFGTSQYSGDDGGMPDDEVPF